MKVNLKTVEFWREVRGPGPRNQSDSTATYSTMKVKSGDKDPTPSGLTIIWDQDAHAVVLAVDTKDDPVVVYGWENVRRAIPEDGLAFMRDMTEEEITHDETPQAKQANAGLAAMQARNKAK